MSPAAPPPPCAQASHRHPRRSQSRDQNSRNIGRFQSERAASTNSSACAASEHLLPPSSRSSARARAECRLASESATPFSVSSCASRSRRWVSEARDALSCALSCAVAPVQSGRDAGRSVSWAGSVCVSPELNGRNGRWVEQGGRRPHPAAPPQPSPRACPPTCERYHRSRNREACGQQMAEKQQQQQQDGSMSLENRRGGRHLQSGSGGG